jgi:hypothetical protein
MVPQACRNTSAGPLFSLAGSCRPGANTVDVCRKSFPGSGVQCNVGRVSKGTLLSL